MNLELFIALLAHDAYNRGYLPDLPSVDETGTDPHQPLRHFLVKMHNCRFEVAKCKSVIGV